MIEAIKKLFGMGKPGTDYKKMVEQGAVVIDVRSRGEYVGGHIKNSINIPLDQLSEGMKKLKKDQAIICCCASGMRSGNAKRILEAKGYKTVSNGGGWMALNRKLQ